MQELMRIAFLPSTFAMYTTMLASSWWFHPATSTPTGTKRAYLATFAYALGAIVGWPFSAALGIPFIFEQLSLTGGEIAVGKERSSLMAARWERLGKAVAVGATIAVSHSYILSRFMADNSQIPVSMVDSWAYGRSTFPTLNIVLYNIFSKTGGPDLYGTSPASYYFQNLFLNFNLFLPIALFSLPALALTYFFDHRRLGKNQQAPKEGETSPYTLLVLRLLPFYIWLAILTLQPHKEERFFFPAYPLLCFNAAVGLYLVRGWMETVYIKLTNSPYEVGACLGLASSADDVGGTIQHLLQVHPRSRRHPLPDLLPSHNSPSQVLSRPLRYPPSLSIPIRPLDSLLKRIFP